MIKSRDQTLGERLHEEFGGDLDDYRMEFPEAEIILVSSKRIDPQRAEAVITNFYSSKGYDVQRTFPDKVEQLTVTKEGKGIVSLTCTIAQNRLNLSAERAPDYR